jgi:hypothetical protein
VPINFEPSHSASVASQVQEKSRRIWYYGRILVLRSPQGGKRRRPAWGTVLDYLKRLARLVECGDSGVLRAVMVSRLWL